MIVRPVIGPSEPGYAEIKRWCDWRNEQEMTRFTFAVCISCGVQSPPIVLAPGEPTELNRRLEKMGWKFDRLRFNVLAQCPKCKVRNAEAAQEAV